MYTRMLGKKRRAAESGKAVDVRNKVRGIRDPIAGTDYRKYHMGPGDLAACLGKAVLLSAALAWLFYHSLAGMGVLVVVGPMFYWMRKKDKIRKRQESMRNQFKECIRIVTASMHAGYSVENAFGEAEKELTLLLGPEADMCRELHIINQQIKLNITIESLLQDLAGRSGVEEISGFGQVFGYAKRNGSDFVRILRDTSERIAQKAELEQEIHTMVAGKQLEQRIMNVVPLGILFFIDRTSPEFLQMMYEGLFGRVIMTFCLLAYAGAYLLSGKLVDIRV